jgi:hypothetical protein
MHPHRMDDRGSAKHLWATTGVPTHRQEHGTRQLPLWRVAGSSRCLRLASAPPWERLPEISKSRNLALRDLGATGIVCLQYLLFLKPF